jgi:two-component system response regulator GlrR
VPRVLVVDDEANCLRVLAMGLRLEGFDVLTAKDAEDALRTLADTSVDIAVVDLMMPRTNGIQLARLLREEHPSIRVVVTSAYPLSECQLLRTDCGAVGFLPKPYDLAEVARYLESKLPTAVLETASPTPSTVQPVA